MEAIFAMTDKHKNATIFQVAELARKGRVRFALEPTPEELVALAKKLDLSKIRKLSFSGEISPGTDCRFILNADLGVTVVQPCVVTQQPVVTRIDTKVARRFVRALHEDEPEPEREMIEDDDLELLGSEVDIATVLEEALSLAIPDYPRADTAEPVNQGYAPPGVAPLTDEDTKPFAGLASLKEKLQRDD